MAGIYIHIPFCRQACHYCDFHFSTNLDNRAAMTKAIVTELALQRNYLTGQGINTIYFGGGTPSLLSTEELLMIQSVIADNFEVAENVEVTLEANPDDLTFQKLLELRQVGFNRLSIGIQSFDNKVLKYLNRAHTADEAVRSINASRQAGFQNISLDLIYAIPGQHPDIWKQNINQAISLAPEHISSYSLTIEKKTAFGNWYERGKLIPLEEDAAAAQLELLVEDLDQAGYEQYEVSNFSKPGFQSQHNSSYWKQEKYLGVGPGAHSYNGGSRQFNVKNNSLYIQSLSVGKIPFEHEILSHKDRVNEYLLTTLRTSWGADLKFLSNDLQCDVVKLNSAYIESLIKNELATIENNFLKLTRRGKLLADKISSDLFLET
jgi:oxygen-independent coproporphyrinogen-3 oxidase